MLAKLAAIGLGVGVTTIGLALSNYSEAAFGYVEECLHPPHFHWYHFGYLHSYDHAAIRRGFQVYDTVGKPCHSMRGQCYRHLTEVAFTADEVRAIANEQEGYLSKPNEEGDVLERRGTPNDKMWAPYKNEPEARFANNGALPPDLTYIVRARHSHEDYIFSLLTGYRDPPHGVVLPENMYYNPYFPGGQISMPPPLTEGAVEYEDGTEASISQMAKDVVTYLTWASYPEQDDRHLMGLKAMTLLTAIAIPLFYYKRFLWATIKNRKVAFLRRTENYKNKIKRNF